MTAFWGLLVVSMTIWVCCGSIIAAIRGNTAALEQIAKLLERRR